MRRAIREQGSGDVYGGRPPDAASCGASAATERAEAEARDLSLVDKMRGRS
jgi:hypothetical protein